MLISYKNLEFHIRLNFFLIWLGKLPIRRFVDSCMNNSFRIRSSFCVYESSETVHEGNPFSYTTDVSVHETISFVCGGIYFSYTLLSLNTKFESSCMKWNFLIQASEQVARTVLMIEIEPPTVLVLSRTKSNIAKFAQWNTDINCAIICMKKDKHGKFLTHIFFH